jgi:hypothetical protein
MNRKRNRWRIRMWRHMLFIAYARVRWPGRITDAKPFKPVWVPPLAITHRLPDHAFQSVVLPPWVVLSERNGRFCPIRSAGFVVPGDWHVVAEAFAPKKIPLYQALEDRYRHGAKWEQTAFFQEAVAAVKRGQPAWNGRRSVAELLANCAKTDRLKESIAKHGIRPTIPPFQVNIGPQGELIRNGEGRHRLLLCLLLEVEKLPVQVVVRHDQWQQIRDAIRTRCPGPEHSDHPDLQDLFRKRESISA